MSLKSTLMDFVYDETCLMLGLDNSKPGSVTNVYPLNSPFNAAGLKKNDTDYVLYLISPTDYGINRQVDIDCIVVNGQTVQRVKQVKTWRLNWEFYGPDAAERADSVRLALLSDSARKDDFAVQGMSLITDIPAPQYVPDAINMQWFERYDLYADFNQLVVTTSPTVEIDSTSITLEDDKGVIHSWQS